MKHPILSTSLAAGASFATLVALLDDPRRFLSYVACGLVVGVALAAVIFFATTESPR